VQHSVNKPHTLAGVCIAIAILLLWGLVLSYCLAYFTIDWANPFTYIWVLVMTHLYTGLFITAHDAMHGTVAPDMPWLNNLLGFICTILDAYNNFGLLRRKHHLHHQYVGTVDDPDFHNGPTENFVLWFFKFLKEYVSWIQILLMAITFNLLYRLFFPLPNVVLYWMLPAVLSTLQLFFFGTYMPHRGQHETNNIHKSGSLTKNHIWAFLTCYFFGYHYEHHDSPGTPWWRLWQKKTLN
jgi:beta-carotene ketolase (CrtW type)